MLCLTIFGNVPTFSKVMGHCPHFEFLGRTLLLLGFSSIKHMVMSFEEFQDGCKGGGGGGGGGGGRILTEWF